MHEYGYARKRGGGIIIERVLVALWWLHVHKSHYENETYEVTHHKPERRYQTKEKEKEEKSDRERWARDGGGGA